MVYKQLLQSLKTKYSSLTKSTLIFCTSLAPGCIRDTCTCTDESDRAREERRQGGRGHSPLGVPSRGSGPQRQGGRGLCVVHGTPLLTACPPLGDDPADDWLPGRRLRNTCPCCDACQPLSHQRWKGSSAPSLPLPRGDHSPQRPRSQTRESEDKHCHRRKESGEKKKN